MEPHQDAQYSDDDGTENSHGDDKRAVCGVVVFRFNGVLAPGVYCSIALAISKVVHGSSSPPACSAVTAALLPIPAPSTQACAVVAALKYEARVGRGGHRGG